MRPEDLDEVLAIEQASFAMPWSRGAFLYEMQEKRVARATRKGDAMDRVKRLIGIVGLVVLLEPSVGAGVYGYVGGPLRNVTDLAPTCAGCHSSFSKEQLRNEPEAVANSQVKENKHY